MFSRLHPVMKFVLVVMLVAGVTSLVLSFTPWSSTLTVWAVQLTFWTSVWIVLGTVSGFFWLNIFMSVDRARMLEACVYNVFLSVFGVILGEGLVTSVVVTMVLPVTAIFQVSLGLWLLIGLVSAGVMYVSAKKDLENR